jgi:hypothetical protein
MAETSSEVGKVRSRKTISLTRQQRLAETHIIATSSERRLEHLKGHSQVSVI